MATTPKQTGVKTTKTMLSILEVLKDRNGATITEVATELGIAKSTVYRHLTTLREQRYVVREGGVFHPSFRFLEFGKHVETRKNGYQMAKQKTKEIAEKTDERSQFVVEEHGQAVYVHRSIGENAVRTDPGPGKRIPIHAVAAGKAILAHLSESRINDIIDKQGLPRITPNTITDREEMFTELERTRERGYSVNDGENLEGLRALGVPILKENGEPLGALTISGPKHRMEGPRYEEELPHLLLGIGNEIELNINHSR